MSKQVIEEEIQTKVNVTEQLLQKLKTSNSVMEWVELLKELPIDRYHNTSEEVKEIVVEKVMGTLDTDFTFANLQKHVILETLRVEKRLKDELEANREKTIHEKLNELAETDPSGEIIKTEITL